MYCSALSSAWCSAQCLSFVKRWESCWLAPFEREPTCQRRVRVLLLRPLFGHSQPIIWLIKSKWRKKPQRRYSHSAYDTWRVYELSSISNWSLRCFWSAKRRTPRLFVRLIVCLTQRGTLCFKYYILFVLIVAKESGSICLLRKPGSPGNSADPIYSSVQTGGTLVIFAAVLGICFPEVSMGGEALTLFHRRARLWRRQRKCAAFESN